MTQELGVVASLAVQTDEQSAGEARRQVENQVAAPLEVGVEIDDSSIREAQEAAQADVDPNFFDIERKHARLERLEAMGERVGGVMEKLGKIPTTPGEAMGMATRGAARAGKSALVKGGVIPGGQSTVASDPSDGPGVEDPGATGPSGAGGGMNEAVLEELRTQTELLDSVEEVLVEEERRDFLSESQGGDSDDGGGFLGLGIGSKLAGAGVSGAGLLGAAGAIGSGGIVGQLLGDSLDMDADAPDDLQGDIRGLLGMDRTFTPETEMEDAPYERYADTLREGIEDAGAPDWISRWFKQDTDQGEADDTRTLEESVEHYEENVIEEPTTRRDTQDHRDRGTGITSGDGEVATGPYTPSQTENRAAETAGTKGGPGLVVNNEYTIDPDAIARKLEEQKRDLEQRVNDLERQLQRSGGLVR